jgi:hypothetical protein
VSRERTEYRLQIVLYTYDVQQTVQLWP